MAPDESIIRLRNIETILSRKLDEIKGKMVELHDHFMAPHRLGTSIATYNGWEIVKVGSTTIYSKQITLAGTTQTENLPLGRTPLLFNHIYMSFSTTNAKTYNIRIYNAATATLYTEFDSPVGLTDPSRIVQLGVEHRSRAHKLEWNFSAYTAGEVINIEVAVEEQ